MSVPRPSITDNLQALGVDSIGPDSSPDTIEAVLRAWSESLNGADQLRIQTERAELIKRTSLTALVVDAALTSRKKLEAVATRQGAKFTLSNPKPWPDAVDGAELLCKLVSVLERFLALPVGAAVAMALWTLHAHVHDAFSISPYLAFTSAVRGSGKTSALTVLHALSPRGLFASNLSTSAVFRTIEAHRPTLFIDEADTFLRDRDDLRGVLNAGHFKAGAVVVRIVGDDFEPRAFSVWCPKAIAKIGKLPPTLADRSIVIAMRRKRPDETVERIRLDHLHSDLNPLLRQAARWAADHLHVLRAADPAVPPELRDRQADNARPLLAIADLAGGKWPEEAQRALVKLQSRDVDEEEAGILLLADFRELFAAKGERLKTAEILEALTAREDRPWGEWRRGQKLSSISLSSLLRAFGIKPRTLRFKAGSTTRTAKGYERESFEDAFSRYLPAPSRNTRNNTHNSATDTGYSTRNLGGDVTGSEPGEYPRQINDVTGVTGQNWGPNEDEEYSLAERAGMAAG